MLPNDSIAIQWLCNGGNRKAFSSPSYGARDWLAGIEPHRKFRCFMQNRELAGISIYRACEDQPIEQIVSNPARWENPIRAWVPAFAAVAPLDDIRFDVVVLDDRVVCSSSTLYTIQPIPGTF